MQPEEHGQAGFRPDCLCRGRCLFGSPVWNDVDDFDEGKEELPGHCQIFGHSQCDEPIITDYFACLDCRRAFRLTEEGVIEES